LACPEALIGARAAWVSYLYLPEFIATFGAQPEGAMILAFGNVWAVNIATFL